VLSEFKEVVAAMQSERQFEAAIAELGASGIDRAQIGVLAQEGIATSCAEAIGCDIKTLPRVEIDLMDDRRQVRTLVTSLAATVASFAGAGVAVAATGGAVAPAVLAALVSGGSIAGLATLFGQRYEAQSHDRIEQQVLQGGILLIVHPANAEQLRNATEILHRHCGRDVVSFSAV
jgi:hypothetical protein